MSATARTELKGNKKKQNNGKKRERWDNTSKGESRRPGVTMTTRSAYDEKQESTRGEAGGADRT